MSETHQSRWREVTLYIERANEALNAATHNLDDGFFAASINRAYYVVFYVANAMLSTHGLARSKHSGVIATFRERFVKPEPIGLNSAESTGGRWMIVTWATMRSLRESRLVTPHVLLKTLGVS